MVRLWCRPAVHAFIALPHALVWFGFVSVWFSVFFRKQICHASWQRSKQRKAIWPAEKCTISTEHWERYAKVSSAHTRLSFFCGVLKTLNPLCDREVQFSSLFCPDCWFRTLVWKDLAYLKIILTCPSVCKYKLNSHLGRSEVICKKWVGFK